MTTLPRVYAGDIGTLIDVDLGEDITLATNISLSVKKPDGKVVTWSPSLQGTTALRYVLQAGDVDLAGIYFIQPKLTLGTWSGSATAIQLTVYPAYN